jgi:3-deoxy-D-manno-octulosonate 8-phosphate phosphatase (KDO 8-P phosphatase)
LTDGNLWLLPGGIQARRMNIRDGYALQLAVKKGYRIFILSGAVSEESRDRLVRLGITDIQMGIKDKASVLSDYLIQHQIPTASVMYMGDDIPDLGAMRLVGTPCCPADAAAEIKQLSVYISPYAGGAGCVRDVLEKVLKLKGDWNEDVSVASV